MQTRHQTEPLRRAIQHNPRDPALHYALGNLLLGHGQTQSALESFTAALKLAPAHPQILLQMGNALCALGRFAEAAGRFREAVRADPGNPAAHYNLGNALRELGQPETAIAAYRQAIRLNPRDADAFNNLGNVLRETGRLDEAIACYRAALQRNPALHHARLHLLHQRQHLCDWEGLDGEIAEIRRLVREEPRAQISPFAFIALPGTSAAEQRRCTENWTSNRYAALMQEAGAANRHFARTEKPVLRIGYLSADFRQHPLASLVTELFEQHDRERFDITAYSCGVNDHSPARKRLERAVNRFTDIRPLPQHEAAARIHADGVDILVDLTGYTQTSRSGILALRPAPIQVNWLGFAGSMGAPFFDYLVTDSFLTPPGTEADYAENLVRLPDTYQPNDRLRPVADTPSRAACGLPADAFVFCCFNQTFKITPQVFGIWMRLLQAVPHSILWLLECNRWAKDNLRREAQSRGVDPERLLFAPRIPMDQHLARQPLANLFLDTLPYNAHTTASDALWAGLPVLTCAGATFASRVAGSLLHTAGLPELVTGSLPEYEKRALHLATHPEALGALRNKLEHVRSTPLFDTERFARNLENAYLAMWRAFVDAKPPQAITLPNTG